MVKVSVIMPNYNTEAYLALAIDSILKQSFSDFELIIIDDCSKDRSPDIISRYQDPRLIRLSNDTNQGISRSLNRGLTQASGTYIAIMHGDDIALKDRLALQVDYLDHHSETGFLGTDILYIDEQNTPLNRPRLYNAEQIPTPLMIRWYMLWGNVVAHPTMMYRRDIQQEYQLFYDSDFDSAEDYDLWSKAIRVTDFSVLAEIGMMYRVHSQSTTTQHQQKQRVHAQTIRQRELSWFTSKPVTPEIMTALGMRVDWMDSQDTADYAGAAELVLHSWSQFCDRYHPNAAEQKAVTAHAAGLIQRVAQRAAYQSPRMTLNILSQLRHLSPRFLISRRTLKTTIKAGLNWSTPRLME